PSSPRPARRRSRRRTRLRRGSSSATRRLARTGPGGRRRRSGPGRRTQASAARGKPSRERPSEQGKLIGGRTDEFHGGPRSNSSNAQPERRNDMTMDGRTRWFALYVLCLASLMIVLDTTIVNVALPSIREDLGFSETSLAWVINAYLLTFGGFLLLGGRLGDLYGQRRLFLAGLAIFTLASLACGFADSQSALIVARAIQGIGGAIASAIALSLVINIFKERGERAKAMGVFGFVMAGGGSIGVLLGGFLTTINWHWNFLINIPIGIAVFLLSLWLLPKLEGSMRGAKLDV